MGDIADDIIDQILDRDLLSDPAKTCKYCGEFPLFWLNKKGKWILIDKKGNKHTCKNYKREDPFNGV
jgi:hypothetical protein